MPIDTHLQQIAARHPSFPNKLKSKSTSTEAVYNQVQQFLTLLWGGQEPEATHLGNGFAGWAQAVMFAADLKGSTAVDLDAGKSSERKRKAGADQDGPSKKGSKSIKFDKDSIKTEQGGTVAGTKTTAPAQPTKAKALKMIPNLEAELLEATHNPNPLVPLLSLARHSDPEVVHKSIWALYRVFIKLIPQGHLAGVGLNAFDRTKVVSKNDETKMVKRWFEERLYDYADILAGLLRDVEPSLRKSACSLIFSLLPPLSAHLSEHMARPIIATAYLRFIVDALLFPTLSLRGATPASSNSVSSGPTLKAENAAHWMVVKANQHFTKVKGANSSVLHPDVVHDVSKKLADYDDLRWATYKALS